MNNTKNILLLSILIGIGLGLAIGPLAGQSDSTHIHNEHDEHTYHNHQKESLLDHLIETGMSQLEVQTNLESLFNDRKRKSYKKAVGTFIFQDGDTWKDSIEVKVRGVFRASKCDNPPLKIKYSKKLLKARGLKKRNEYKLVYPCKNEEEYQNYIYKEYLIYKLYNELTERSLRVHLIDFTLRDSADRMEPIKSTGFMIEHREELIKRLDAEKNDTRCLPIKNLSAYDYTLFQVFQFMIGNVDWLIPNCKNSEVIQLKDSIMIPIPYDFDYTGFVNPSYAVPFATFKQKEVTDRYFLGHKKDIKDLMPVFDLFKEKENTFINIIDSFEYLPKKDRKILVKYLNSFYKILEQPKKIKKVFVHDMGDMKGVF